MSKRNYIRIISFIVFGIGVLSIYSSLTSMHMDNYKKSLESTYQQSLIELNECLDSIETDLTKCLYSNSKGEIYDLSRDIFSQCSTAKNAISRLPVDQMNLQGTYKFLSQAGDYAIYIGDKLEVDDKINNADQDSIFSLLSYAKDFSTSTNDMISVVENGGRITDNQVISTLDYNTNNALSNSFSTNEESFDNYPTLLYDGPFSDQRINKYSVFLNDKETLPLEKCRQYAAKALGTATANIGFSTDEDSAICCYNFKHGRNFVAITKNGGYVKSILNSGFVNETIISVDSAIENASKYLKSIGYENMEENYYTINNNICTINYAYSIGDTYYYPDLIKVSVSMQDGTIMGLDASTYLMNHNNRNDFESKYNSKDAEQCISPFLDIIEVKKCVIPKSNGKEVPCWEFRCKNNNYDTDALVYINANTLEEEQIQILLYSDNGVLVK